MEVFNLSYSFRGIKDGHVCGTSFVVDANEIADFFPESFGDILKCRILNKDYGCLCPDSCGMNILDRVQFFSHGMNVLKITVAKLPDNLPVEEEDTVFILNADGRNSNIPQAERDQTLAVFLRSKLTSDPMVDTTYRYKDLMACFQFTSIEPYTLHMLPTRINFPDPLVYEAMPNNPDPDKDPCCVVAALLDDYHKKNLRYIGIDPEGHNLTLTHDLSGDRIKCYFYKKFKHIWNMCFSDTEFVKSLKHSNYFSAVGGKSNAYFAKTLDERLIIKGVPGIELNSFVKFGLEYFNYLALGSRSCLARILGVFQVTTKKGTWNLIVMENTKFERVITETFDLKGSANSRLCPSSSITLLDENFIGTMKDLPIFLTKEDHGILKLAVSMDAAFLSKCGVMDYSLLVGINRETHELTVGIIDYLRPYSWDKKVENWWKILLNKLKGKEDVEPTVIPPGDYMLRFQKAIENYFHCLSD